VVFEGTYPRETGDCVIDGYPLAFGTSHATAWIRLGNFMGCVMYHFNWIDILKSVLDKRELIQRISTVCPWPIGGGVQKTATASARDCFYLKSPCKNTKQNV